jgi:hypothetical protein
MDLTELYKKNGLDPTRTAGLSKLMEIFDTRLDALEGRAESIEAQLKPLYQAIILNSPNLREEVAKRVLKMIGVDGPHGVPPIPSGGPAPASPTPEQPSVLTFKCRICTTLTDDAKRVRVDGHHDIFVCPHCAGKLSDIVSALLS